MNILSPAFMHEDTIPPEYTCDRDNINPPLTFSDIPVLAKSLVLIMDDPDAPSGVFTHWTVYDMATRIRQLDMGEKPSTGLEGMTDFGSVGYGGPCPPPGSKPHRYYFRLYALDGITELPEGAGREDLDDAMQGMIIETATLLGYYEKLLY